jgi:DNA-binding transcriptional MerR regulator
MSIKQKGAVMVKTKKAKIDLLVPSPSFTSLDVSELTGVSLRQLQWWDEKKVVSPRQEGHRRLYLTEEVLEISVIAELRRKGFSLQKIRRVLRFLQKNIGKRLSEVLDVRSDLHLVTDGKSIYLEDNAHLIIDILKNARQPMFLVCVSDQVRRIQAALPPAKKPVGRESASTQLSRKAR